MASKALLMLLPLLASCSIYQSGSIDQSSLSSGCSVSDIDRYIEETSEGPNVYLDRDYDDRLISGVAECSCEREKSYKVWMEGYESPDGIHKHAGYLVINLEDRSCCKN